METTIAMTLNRTTTLRATSSRLSQCVEVLRLSLQRELPMIMQVWAAVLSSILEKLQIAIETWLLQIH